MNKNFDPKLKEAMQEINIIMEKYDIGGYVTLVSPTHSEYLYKIDPSWSCARFTQGMLRFKATEADYGSKAARNKAMELTVHLLLQIRDLGAKAFEFGELVKNKLTPMLEINHVPFSNHTPHELPE